MKLRYWFVLLCFLVVGLVSWSSDYILVPEKFFLHKGDSLNVHLFSAEMFDNAKELKYDQANTESFALYTDGKRFGLKGTVKDGATPVLSSKMNNSGLAMVEMVRSYPADDYDRTDFQTDLENEGLIKLSEKVNNMGQNRLRVKFTGYLKSLVTVDKPSGSLYSSNLGHQLEIILKTNPYKLNYGDDVTALVLYKNKPLPNAKVDLLIRTSSGKIYPQRFITDGNGALSFSVSREGVYLLRLVYVEASTSKAVDFEKWGAAFSFAFSNNGTMPNTYREFGLGSSVH